MSFCLVMARGWMLAKEGGLNQGLVLVVLGCAGFWNAILFYFAFGERISMVSFIGISIMLACVVCISIEKEEEEETELVVD